MADIMKNTVLGGAALAGTEYLSGGVVSDVAGKVADVVTNVVSGTGPVQPIISKLSPLAGVVAAPALGIYSVYKGVKETMDTHLYNGVQRGLLTFGGWGTAATMTGLLSVPVAPAILAGGLGMYGVKKVSSAIADSYSTIKSSHPIDYTIESISNLPGKTWKGLKSMVGMNKNNN